MSSRSLFGYLTKLQILFVDTFLLLPLRCMKFTSNKKMSVDQILGSGGNILVEAADGGEEDILLSATSIKKQKKTFEC